MKNTIRWTLFMGLGIFLASCIDLDKKKEEKLADADFIPIKINNDYQLSLPKYFTKAKNLNDDASLQFQNIFKETYVIVIDEPKEKFISTFQELGEYFDSLSVAENYRNIQMQSLSENVQFSSSGSPKSVKIGGLDAQVVELDGKVEGVKSDISYLLTFIEGKENIYMIMAWTLKERKEKYFGTFGKMVNSFKLLPGSKSEFEK